MTGRQAYDDKFERMSLKRIENSDPEWYLYGFYNSVVIKRSYKTAYEYLGYVIEFLEKSGGRLPEYMTIDDYYKYMASIRGCSCSKQIGAYHSLKKYTKYLSSMKICEDFMQYIDRPKFFEEQETINKREKGFLTKKEAKIMVDSIDRYSRSDIWKVRDKAIMLIFLTTGIRLSAMYKLDVNDVNIENKTITVKEKGSKNRVIDIPELTVEAIKEWLNYRNEIVTNDENALIISSQRRRMESESIYVVIKKYGKIIAGKNITPHKLRATYGTNLYNKTGDIYFVQQCMGHSSPTTTEIYIRGKKNEFSQKAANIMENFLD